ncbi:MAG: AMP-binding protein [Acidobacteriota bacterium]|nr:AMP-binding protein [Acidobacteriota bacterium]
MSTLVDLLQTSAQRYPRRTATVMRIGLRTIHYTYAELEQRARGYAQLLQQHGIGPGDRVVLWSPNQPEWVAAMFGGFLAGAVLVPLDVTCTLDEVARMIGQTEPKLALTTKRFGEVLREFSVPALEFETQRVPDGRAARIQPVAAETLAEIVFTSGTTGDPKGVMLSHGNIASNVAAVLRAIPVPRDARMLSLLPLSHVFEQVGGCFCPLAVGGAIRYRSTHQPFALAATMRDWRPTILAGVPQLLSLVMVGIEREAAARGRLGLLERLRKLAARLPRRARRLLFASVLARLGGALEFVISGGGALDPEIQRKWEAMGVDVLEGYGATECAAVITSNALGAGRIGSVGKPLPGQEIRLAADGEVLTRGPNVFAGYWRNDAATATAFEDGWYRTGDLGQVDGDGYLHLKGRKKDLIVLPDGQNVNPDDVEVVLRRQPGIADAVVIGVGRYGSVRVHAVLIESDPGAAAAAVRSANALLDARQQVMDYTVWPEPHFPRTHTAKIRRPLVIAYVEEQAYPAASPPALPPDTDPLLRIVAQARQGDGMITDAMALGDDLGLDSLVRAKLLSALEDELGVYVDDTKVGPHTTVAALRALVALKEPRPRSQRLPEWPRRFPAVWVRPVLMSAVIFPLLRLLYAVEVRGMERLRALDTPCLVASNHILHLDAALLLQAMPGRLRRRIAIAAAAPGVAQALLGNAFLFSKDSVRESLEYGARTLEEGWAVLIFPEGMLTMLGPMQPFKSGTGLLAVEAGVPVLPMRLDVLRPGSPDGRGWLPPVRGRVRISFGAPLRFAPDTTYAEATAALERAVREA